MYVRVLRKLLCEDISECTDIQTSCVCYVMSCIICCEFENVFANALLLVLTQHFVVVTGASLQVLHVTIM